MLKRAAETRNFAISILHFLFLISKKNHQIQRKFVELFSVLSPYFNRAVISRQIQHPTGVFSGLAEGWLVSYKNIKLKI
jgi:hypothetical protein